MPSSHVRRVFIVLALLVPLYFGFREIMRPADFGDRGPYRAGSLTEILAQEPVHLGKRKCQVCHSKVFDLHEKDFHFDVECEDCHGPGREHVQYHLDFRDDGGAEADGPPAKLPKEYTREGCLFCHRRLNSRPRTFPQVDPEEHYAFLGVNDPETRCIACHSPHEPIFVLKEVRTARIHPLIYECRHCHDEEPAGDFRKAEGHPTIFVCRDCHPGVVEDFAKRQHSFMRCTACHLFHFENENAGRILKNGNRRFCLLCHQKAPFREGARQPLIDWEAHLAEFAELLQTSPDELEKDPRTCLRCHRRHIHGKSGRKR